MRESYGGIAVRGPATAVAGVIIADTAVQVGRRFDFTDKRAKAAIAFEVDRKTAGPAGIFP